MSSSVKGQLQRAAVDWDLRFATIASEFAEGQPKRYKVVSIPFLHDACVLAFRGCMTVKSSSNINISCNCCTAILYTTTNTYTQIQATKVNISRNTLCCPALMKYLSVPAPS